MNIIDLIEKKFRLPGQCTGRNSKCPSRLRAPRDRLRGTRLAVVLVAMSMLLSGSVRARQSKEAAPQIRLAIIGLNEEGPDTAAIAVDEALAEDARVVVIESSQVKAAASGIGYAGSINLGKDEARRFGAAIGCEFFIIGQVRVSMRSERANESHGETIIAVMLVDGRSGALASFEFIAEERASADASLAAAIGLLKSRVPALVDRAIAFRSSREAALSSPNAGPVSRSGVERIEDLPGEGSATSADFTPPELLNRVKPEYTGQADRAGVTAAVEALAVFRSNGEVGAIEITRWAGFGLDDSAARAIRQLKFKPATRNGKPVSVRALIRYNFRRSSEPAPVLLESKPTPEETPERDLRELFRRSNRRPL